MIRLATIVSMLLLTMTLGCHRHRYTETTTIHERPAHRLSRDLDRKTDESPRAAKRGRDLDEKADEAKESIDESVKHR